MRNKFDRQLSTLNSELITMGALCEEAISKAIKYLETNKQELKEQVFETDREIDRKEREIESLCMRLLMQQQPVARDLRTISSALKMISDMERIGDQALDIAEIADFVNRTDMVSQVHITDMARATISMVTDSIDSFVKHDMQMAQKVIEQDDIVDELFIKVKGELIASVKTANDDMAEALIDLLMIAKYFERIGDHAENIAEWVIFSITGTHKSIEID